MVNINQQERFLVENTLVKDMQESRSSQQIGGTLDAEMFADVSILLDWLESEK